MTIFFLAAIDFWHISNIPVIQLYNWLSVLANDNVMVTRAYHGKEVVHSEDRSFEGLDYYKPGGDL